MRFPARWASPFPINYSAVEHAVQVVTAKGRTEILKDVRHALECGCYQCRNRAVMTHDWYTEPPKGT